MTDSPAMLPKVRSKMIMDAPKNLPEMGCQLRLASFLGLPCSGRDTLVMAHNDFSPGSGMSTKNSALEAICGCHLCHALLGRHDARGVMIRDNHPHEFYRQIIRASASTRAWLVSEGIITVKDGELV